MTVTLQWSLTGNFFKEVLCEAEEWGTIVHGDQEAWSYVPTRKLHVVRADGITPLEGLFLAAGAEITLPIYAKPANFHNALAGVNALPNGQRKWQKEFKQHVAETYYRTLAHWNLTVKEQDFWILRMLQVWVRETRIRFYLRFPRGGLGVSDELRDKLRFWGRLRYRVTEGLADRFHIDDDDADKEFRLFVSTNEAAHLSFTQFLWTDENQFHCFVL